MSALAGCSANASFSGVSDVAVSSENERAASLSEGESGTGTAGEGLKGSTSDTRTSGEDISENTSGEEISPGNLSEAGKVSKKATVPEYVFTYAENQTSDYPTTVAARHFAELVSERTGGRIEIRVYPNAELGDERSTVQQISFGGIDFGRASLSNLADYSPKSVVLQMPYLYKDAHHMWEVLDGDIGREMKASFQGTGLVALTWFDAGARNFYTKTPVRTLSDMKGLKYPCAAIIPHGGCCPLPRRKPGSDDL